MLIVITLKVYLSSKNSFILLEHVLQNDYFSIPI
nr:ALPV-227 [Albatrosspox virus]